VDGLMTVCHNTRKGGNVGSRWPNHVRASALLDGQFWIRLRLVALRSFAAKMPYLYSTDHQPLAINPLSNASKPPQKMTVSAGKTAFPPNYFRNRIQTLPTTIAIPPLFFRVLVAVLALIFAMKIVPTVGMTNFGNHAVIVP
jgi:hypothetical protein